MSRLSSLMKSSTFSFSSKSSRASFSRKSARSLSSRKSVRSSSVSLFSRSLCQDSHQDHLPQGYSQYLRPRGSIVFPDRHSERCGVPHIVVCWMSCTSPAEASRAFQHVQHQGNCCKETPWDITEKFKKSIREDFIKKKEKR